MLHAGADASAPGKPLPPGTTIVCGYVGAPDLPGQPDARHVWTLAEWNLYLEPSSALYGGAELRALPIYVHDSPGNAVQDAANAADAVTDLGWAAGIGRIIVWDAETLVDPAYCSDLNTELRRRGFRMCKYGSQGTINRNPAVDGGSWIATDSKVPVLSMPGDRVGEQWLFSQDWDLNAFDAFVYANCGYGPRRPRP